MPMGGETCADEPYTDLAFESFPAYAKRELGRMHWTTLNSDYNQGTLDALGDYIEEVKRRLGYRFVLQSSQLPKSAEAGSEVDLSFVLENVGYASPFNPRGLAVVFRGADGKLVSRPVKVERKENTDPRFWQPGETQNVKLTVAAPDTPGDFEVLLDLPDPLLPNVVSYKADGAAVSGHYSVRLANEGVWEADTGLNRLAHTLDVR